MTIHHPPQEPISNLYTDEPIRSPPIHSNGTHLEDGYFELSDSVTGPDGRTTTDGVLGKGLPASSISGRDSGVATLDEPIDRGSFGSSGSSLPSESAPPPPPKTLTNRRTSLEGPNDIYDTPPVHQSHRHSFTNDSGAIYDCPPGLKRRPSQPVEEIDETEALYKQVPAAPRRSVTSSLDYPLSPMKNGFEPQDTGSGDIYDVPPVMRELPKQVYDTPPGLVVKHEELSQSTDNLAKTFQNISFRNSMGTNSITSESFDLYDIPGSQSSSLNDSGQFTSSMSSRDRGPVSPPMDAAPPRPPKPSHMQNLDPTTPPPSFDDTYNIPLNLQPQSHVSAADLTKRLSQEVQGQTSDNYETPPMWSHTGHMFMESQTTNKPRYINTKRTESTNSSGMPINSLRSRGSLDGAIPAPSPDSYVNVRNERYTFSPKQSVQSCYLPMQGGTVGSCSNFEFTDEPYMPMEGSIDGMADSYTFMQSPSAFSETPPPIVPRSKSVSSRNSQGEFPPPIPRSLSTSSRNSQGEIPPPVNRSSKPIDRRSTSSSLQGKSVIYTLCHSTFECDLNTLYNIVYLRYHKDVKWGNLPFMPFCCHT